MAWWTMVYKNKTMSMDQATTTFQRIMKINRKSNLKMKAQFLFCDWIGIQSILGRQKTRVCEQRKRWRIARRNNPSSISGRSPCWLNISTEIHPDANNQWCNDYRMWLRIDQTGIPRNLILWLNWDSKYSFSSQNRSNSDYHSEHS